MNMEGAWYPPAIHPWDNKMQFNGKELNEEFGLGWMNFPPNFDQKLPEIKVRY